MELLRDDLADTKLLSVLLKASGGMVWFTGDLATLSSELLQEMYCLHLVSSQTPRASSDRLQCPILWYL